MKPSNKQNRRKRELIILASVLLFFIVVAIFTPQRSLTGDWTVSTLNAEPPGGRVLYELADRLGWRVARSFADTIVPDRSTIAVVLNPRFPYRAKEVHALLNGVRRGGALVYAMGDDVLSDSLNLRVGQPGYEVHVDSLAPVSPDCEPPSELSDRVITMFRGRRLFLLALEDSGAIRTPVDTLLRIETRVDDDRDSSSFMTPPIEADSAPQLRAAVIGFRFGLGRIVAVADVDIFRNDNLRVCAWNAAVQAVRIFEYLSGGTDEARRSLLLFDEYHQGRGVRPGTTRAILQYLRNTASGKALAHLGIAGLILVVALGPRALPPRETERIERRSPLEHVEALARAYWHVDATRTATRRLLRGVRRRTEHRFGSARRDVADELFLDWIEQRLPQRHTDIAFVRRALTTAMPRKEFTRVGEALARIEQDLLTFRA